MPTSIYGSHLKELVEERLKFYESGETPRKNCDVMGIAAAEVFYSIISFCILI